MGIHIDHQRWAIVQVTADGVPGIVYTGTLPTAKQIFRRLYGRGPSHPTSWPIVGHPYRQPDGTTATLTYLDPHHEP